MPTSVPSTGPYDADFDSPLDDDLGEYEPDRDERQLGLIAHLLGFAGLLFPFGNVLAPLAIYFAKRDESAFVEDQAREALNFQIWMVIATIGSAILIAVGIGVLLLPIVLVGWFVGTVVGAIRANEGEWYRYPWTVRLIK